MNLVTIRQLSIRYRGPALLDEIDCQIESGQRIGLLGRNGAGKSTLLRILCGQVEPDSGDVAFAPGTRVALLEQDVPRQLTGTVREVTSAGARDDVSLTVGRDEAESDWRREHRVDEVLSRMELDAEAPFETLSSGMKRRVLLARALASGPELLLLDEPTNHLDIDAIAWLEDFLPRSGATLVFVTHDRMFLRRLANRIWEIDRGRLFDWSCDYGTFLERKEAALAAEEKQQALFDKKLAEEEAWIRQGIKARRTRNEGRVRALEAMRRERRERQARPDDVKLQIQEGQRSGTLVVAAENISFSFGDRTIVRDFSTTVLRGDKVGVIGPNGAGKSTLLQLLLGRLEPQTGTVRPGTNLQIAYFDQLREQLDEDKTVQENVGDGYDSIQIGGKSTHIIGYLQDFLFSPERARTPVRFLSGGERNRILLARLFAKPANVIVLDEPTNDLDAETLELLESRLVDFGGTVLLVSHDREFLNNVVGSTIVFEAGRVKEYDGGYDDWLRQREHAARTLPVKAQSNTTATRPKKSAAPTAVPSVPAAQRKLSYNEKRELENLPARIETIERSIDELHQTMAEPSFYQQAGDRIAAEQARLSDLEQQLAASYERWEELEERAG